MTTGLLPAMAAFLTGMAPKDSEVHKLAAYHDLLSSFDWQYAYTDEHARWKQGKAAHGRLVKLQMDIDPDAVIWMSYPGAQKHGAAQPVLRGGQR